MRCHVQLNWCVTVCLHTARQQVCVCVCWVNRHIHTYTVGSICLTARQMDTTDAHVTFTYKTLSVDLTCACVCARMGVRVCDRGSRGGEEKQEGEKREKLKKNVR